MQLTNKQVEELLSDARNGMSISDLQLKYKRSRETIRLYFKKNNIVYANSTVPFTQEEIDFLKENFSKIGLAECSKILKRSRSAISRRARKLNLKRIKGGTLIGEQCMCCSCRKFKPIEQFNKNAAIPSGYELVCKECKSIKKAIRTKDILADPNKRKFYWLKRVLQGAKERSKEKNLEFSLVLDDFINEIPDFCPILKIPLTFGGTKKTVYSSASLDRIDSRKGYTKDNVIIICARANTLKNSSNHKEREKIYSFYKQFELEPDFMI